MNILVCEGSTLIPFSLDKIFSDNYIRLLKFVSYGHFPEPPNQIRVI
jgi:hypothetical protein